MNLGSPGNRAFVSNPMFLSRFSADYRQHAPSLPQAVRPVLTKTTHRIVHRKEADSHLSCITNVLWFIFGGYALIIHMA